MLRRRGRIASRRTRPAEPSARPVSATVADRPARTTTSTKPASFAYGGREPTTREVRDRAYFIYLARGGVNGDPVGDWVRAERELRTELRGPAPDVRRF